MEVKTHWKKLHNPDYLGAYAFQPGQDLIATIQSVRDEMITGADGKKEECMVMHFSEKDIKPLIVNVTNAKQIEKLFKTPYVEDWAGRKVQLYVEKVKAFGEVVDAVRVRPFQPKQKEYICHDCKKKIEDAGGKTATGIAETTQRKYGAPLCSECATKRYEAKKKEDVLSNEDDANQD